PFALRGKHKNDTDQTKRLYSLYVETDCDCDGFRKAFEVPHGYVTAMTLPPILVDECDFPPGFAQKISELIGGHHGIFATESDFQRIDDYGERRSIGNASWARSRRELFRALSDILDISFEAAAVDDGSLDCPTEMVFAGFVSVADWIGSNPENDLFTCAVDDS